MESTHSASSSPEDLRDEKAELELVLAEVLRPKSNMAQLLRYVAQKRFDGLAHEVKEYNIAVEAFGRPAEFDPSRDSIVRVEAHRLRNRLERHYRQAGAKSQIRIVVPPGNYVPQFLRMPPQEEISDIHQSSELERAPQLTITTSHELERVAPAMEWTPSKRRKTSARVWWMALILLMLVAVTTISGFWHWRLDHPKDSAQSRATVIDPSSKEGVHVLSGLQSPTLVDSHGQTWTGDRFFSNGDGESIPSKTIAYTDDPTIYLRRRRGTFTYNIPLAPGTYELRLYFADAFFGENNADGGGESSRIFDVKANGEWLLRNFDVISDAGGSNTADIKVFKDIQPGKDGKLKLDFIAQRDVAFVNAIEVLPSAPHHMRPIRIVMSESAYKDADGHVWSSDRYSRGGVRFRDKNTDPKAQDSELLLGERFGNFTYTIPVPADGTYQATLRFRKNQRSAPTGTGPAGETDVFSVYLNGLVLLDHFEVKGDDANHKGVTKVFRNLHANAQGKLIFSFVPITNYALVNSLEIIDQE
jgi:hypothetical protein